MRNEKVGKVLDLILELLDNRDQSIAEICDRLSLSRRTFYYLLDAIKSYGFMVFKNGNSYHIDRRSPFVSRVSQSTALTDTELLTIWNLLGMVGTGNETVNTLRRKLDAEYDFSKTASIPAVRHRMSVIKKLTAAITRKRMVKLVNYSSPHSQSERDRIVEPFFLMNNNRDVRCYEPSSGMNKTFKVTRIGDAEVLDDQWANEDKHRQVFTDIFMFSGEEHHNVRLRLGLLSKNLFEEEYPQATKNIQPDETDQRHWILELEVCDYRGIGRFVLGLFDDIEVLGDEKFKEYITKEVENMYSRISTSPSQ